MIRRAPLSSTSSLVQTSRRAPAPARGLLALALSLLTASAALAGCGSDNGGPNRGDQGSAGGDDQGPGGGDQGTAPDVGVRDGSAPDLNVAAVCGDGVRAGSEACDDGNRLDDDGCSPDCDAVDPNYACPVPNTLCVRVVTCGNGRIEGPETCDDGDALGDDGCSDVCAVEPGWTCPTVGAACVARECGDGIVAGFEACDDGNNPAPGCTAGCQLEEGYLCAVEGAACTETTCGDNVTEGTEECDDGNPAVGDGCDPFCKREPDCTGGVCVAVCGDGLRWAPEACDDGNTVGGDGCSADCSTVEQGFACVEVALAPPASVELPATFRDFRQGCFTDDGGFDGYPLEGEAGATAPYGHPDFHCYSGAQTGIVQNTLSADGKPQLNASTRVTSAASFAQWYRSDPTVNRTVAGTLLLPSIGGGAYRFDSVSFFPLTGRGFDVETCGGSPCEDLYVDNNSTAMPKETENFYFTSEVRFWFQYAATEVLEFSGDDDVWVFIDGQLAVDIGGVHGRLDGSITLAACNNANPAMNAASCISDLALTEGGIYEAVVFQAERHTTRSQYRLTLTNFTRAPSQCTDMCGDGMQSSREACDLGGMNGMGDGSAYGGCTTGCVYEPYCGDGVVDDAFGEVCDDGLNLGGEASSCAPGCMTLGARCGDGVVQVSSGEQCDDANTNNGDGCDAACLIEFG